jgi:hypothetical protein
MYCLGRAPPKREPRPAATIKAAVDMNVLIPSLKNDLAVIVRIATGLQCRPVPERLPANRSMGYEVTDLLKT